MAEVEFENESRCLALMMESFGEDAKLCGGNQQKKGQIRCQIINAAVDMSRVINQ